MRKNTGKSMSSAKPVQPVQKRTLICKNCSTHVEGKFCHHCGQRFHNHKESFGELVYEFGSDFLHFDSKFFRTLVPLLFSPGTITKSYNEGKRQSQFNPIRLYLFSSFVYFFLFFYFNNITDQLETVKIAEEIPFHDTNTRINEVAPLNKPVILNDSSSFRNKPYSDSRTLVSFKNEDINYALTITPKIDSLIKNKVTPEEYKEIQKKLSPEQRDSFYDRMMTMKMLEFNLAGEQGKKELFIKLTEKFLHNIPKMMFFLLPVFALILKLLYVKRKQFYYVDHAILSLHYFSFVFLMLIFCNFLLDRILGTSFFVILAFIWISIYLLVAMKKLYSQGWIKTILKFCILGILFLGTVIFTLLVNMAISTLI